MINWLIEHVKSIWRSLRYQRECWLCDNTAFLDNGKKCPLCWEKRDA